MATKETSTKRKPNEKFMKPVQPSAELAAVVGNKPMPRTEITKALWVYIKKHNLQNPENKREIVPDEALAKVFGTKKGVDMFKMVSLVNKHLS